MTLNILSRRIATTSWLTSYKLETKQPGEQDGILTLGDTAISLYTPAPT